MEKSDEGVDRARRRERGRFGGQIYCSVEKRMEEWGGGGEESDRLDHECTHRHTLFNVSLTFLFSISSLLTRSRRRDGQQRRRGERERDGERERREEAALLLQSNQGPETQTKSGVRVHRGASQSGGEARRESRSTRRSLVLYSSSSFSAFCVFSSDTRCFPSICALFHPMICGLVMKL